MLPAGVRPAAHEWTRSEVAALTPAEFDEFEAEITEQAAAIAARGKAATKAERDTAAAAYRAANGLG